MSQLPDAQHKLVAAEHAAVDGDLGSADALLRDAARIQEAELGPRHPDLASTLNNLAVVAEKLGRRSDAETFYRRAAAIAEASLPADHPLVAASRQNLEDFCRAWGLPTNSPAFTEEFNQQSNSGPELADGVEAEAAHSEVQAPDGQKAHSGEPITAPPVLAPSPPSRSPSSSLVLAVTGVAILVTAALFAMRPWSPREPSPVAAAAAARAPQPAAPEGPSHAAREAAEPPTSGPRGGDRGDREVAITTPLARGRSAAPITLAAVELCQTFSPRGPNWRCDPAGDLVAPGPIVLFTRVTSARDGAVVHRWYHDDRLRQSITLTTRANPTEGYRTYSRQTVSAGNWRVEVSSAAGAPLHEQRFTVR